MSAGAPSDRLPSPAAPWHAAHCPCQICALGEPESETVMVLAAVAEESVVSPPQLIKEPSRANSVTRWRMLAGRLLVEEAAQVIGAGGVAQFAQCLGFDLTNPLARHVKLLADLFQGVVGVHIDTKAHTQHFGFTRG